MSSTYTLFRNLNASRSDWELKARVSRIWDAYSFGQTASSSSHFSAYELLLIDEEGVEIVAHIKTHWFDRYRPRISEGGLYTIKNCSVRPARSTYRVSSNDSMLYLLQTTTIDPFPADDSSIPLHKFDFLGFGQLHERLNSTRKLADVGRLYHSTAAVMCGAGNNCKRRVHTLDDTSRNHIEITILGDKADLINDAEIQGSPVIIVTSIHIKTWNDMVKISSTNSTRIYRNVDIPETQAFENEPLPVGPVVDVLDRVSVKLTYEGLIAREKTLGELAAFCRGVFDKPSVFYVRGTISSIIFEKDWSYPACDQHIIIVSTSDRKFFCDRCDGEPPKTSLRYRLEVKVAAAAETGIFTLFDREAVKLLNISASDLALEAPEIVDSTSMPTAMKDIIGLDLLFCIRLTEFNFTSPRNTFTVIRTYSVNEIPTAPEEAASATITPPETGAPFEDRGKRPATTVGIDIPI